MITPAQGSETRSVRRGTRLTSARNSAGRPVDHQFQHVPGMRGLQPAEPARDVADDERLINSPI
jgi:hypothetical protein